jgi:hypothetical protein
VLVLEGFADAAPAAAEPAPHTLSGTDWTDTFSRWVEQHWAGVDAARAAGASPFWAGLGVEALGLPSPGRDDLTAR